jgi:hypothetical protein
MKYSRNNREPKIRGLFGKGVINGFLSTVYLIKHKFNNPYIVLASEQCQNP